MLLAGMPPPSVCVLCSAATMSRLRAKKYACQSLTSSLSVHARCQMAAPGRVTVG